MTDFFCEVFQVLLILRLIFGVCWPTEQIKFFNSVRVKTVFRGGKLGTSLALTAVRIQHVASAAAWLHTVVALAEGCCALFIYHYFTLRPLIVVIYFMHLSATCSSYVFRDEQLRNGSCIF